MNLLAWVLALSLMVSLMVESVVFYQATVCRQKAWLKGTELITRTLLHSPLSYEQRVDISCKLYASRTNKRVTWHRLPNLKKHEFRLDLKGKL
jgi:hypothetical protein